MLSLRFSRTVSALAKTNAVALLEVDKTAVMYSPVDAVMEALNAYDMEAVEPYIVGVIVLRHNSSNSAMEVDSVWAQKGFGPHLYMWALAYSGKLGLIANRISTKVSDAARTMWRSMYDGKNKDLVTKEPIGDSHHKHAELNYKYKLRRKPRWLSVARRKNAEIVGHDPYDERKTILMEAGDSLLHGKMMDMYG